MSAEAIAYIAELDRLGRTSETADDLYKGLVNAVEDARPTSSDLDFADWSRSMVRKARAALRNELCDETKKALKDRYNDLLAIGVGSEQAKAIAGTVTTILGHVNPALAVPPVVAFASLWIARVGLNKWCGTPSDQASQ
jgi:hypothetical protein